MKSKRDNFFTWLSNEVPSFRLSDYFLVADDLEIFARKKLFIKTSIFDVNDPTVTGKIVTAVSSDKIFRFTHKKQIKNIAELAQYLHKYTKEQASAPFVAKSEGSLPYQNEVDSSIDNLLAALDHAFDSSMMNEAKVSESEASENEFYNEADTTENDVEIVETQKGDAPTVTGDDTKPRETESTYTVDFVNVNDYSFTSPLSVSYFGLLISEFSWHDVYVKTCELLLEDYPSDFESLRDNDGDGSRVFKLIYGESESGRMVAPVKIGEGYYVETKRSASDLIRNIKSLLDYCRVDYENLIIKYKKLQKSEVVSRTTDRGFTLEKEDLSENTFADPLITYLKQCNLTYIDLRHKQGCLWIIGGRDITDKMEVLHKQGIRMHFRSGGGNVTNGKDAWWTKDSLSESIRLANNSDGVEAQSTPGDVALKRCTIQEGRGAFLEWMVSNNINSSSARTASWALTKVSNIAIEQGLTTEQLYTICDAKEVNQILDRLEKNLAFQHYRRQNSVALFAARKYAAFRTDQEASCLPEALPNDRKTADSKEYSNETALKSYSLEKRTLHPGRIEFEEWLLESKCPAGSVKTYSDSVESIGKYILETGLEDRNIFTIRGILRLEKIRETLLCDKNFTARRGVSVAQLDLYALKKYISFRKNSESSDTEDVSRERFAAILHDYFENGFRINSMIDRNRFKKFFADVYGTELSQTDDELLHILKKIGSIQDDRIFMRESNAQNDLLDDIHADIAKAFIDGISCVYFSELFAHYQNKLAEELQIFSPDVLKNQLLLTSYGEYQTSKQYFYRKDRNPDAMSDIQKLLSRSNVPLNYNDIYERLRFIPLDVIRHSLSMAEKIVNVALETYFYAPNLPVSAEELEQIATLIHGQLEQKSYIVDTELRDMINQHCPSIAINTASFSTWGLRNALGVLLGDRFSFKGAIISEHGQEINMSQVFSEFCRSHETMTIEELRQFSKDMNTIIYWETVYEEMVRVSQEEFIRKDQVHFDICATDSVLDELIDGDYEVLQNFKLFLHFPVIDVRWNSFVLESYVANYSQNFKLLHASYTATGCYGAVVRKDSSIAEFKDLVTDVLTNSTQWKNKDDALELLVEKGFLQRKRYSEIDTIIKEANHRRDLLQRSR